MLEAIMVIAVFVIVARAAAMSGQNAFLWCCATILLLGGCYYLIPFASMRVAAAAFLTLVAMTIYNIAFDK